MQSLRQTHISIQMIDPRVHLLNNLMGHLRVWVEITQQGLLLPFQSINSHPVRRLYFLSMLSMQVCEILHLQSLRMVIINIVAALVSFCLLQVVFIFLFLGPSGLLYLNQLIGVLLEVLLLIRVIGCVEMVRGFLLTTDAALHWTQLWCLCAKILLLLAV